MTAITPPAEETTSFAVRPVSALRPNPLNPRGPVVEDEALRELADSIRAQGILQPLIITPDGLLITGHRRLAAARLAGCDTVPCVVRAMGTTAQLVTMIVENSHRRDIDPLRLAAAYQRLHDEGLTDAEIGRLVGKAQNSVNRYRQLVRLPEHAQEEIAAGSVNPSIGMALVRFAEQPAVLDRLLCDIPRYNLTVKEIDALDDDGNPPSMGGTRTRKRPVGYHSSTPLDARDFEGGHSVTDARLAEREFIAEWVRERASLAATRELRAALFELANDIEHGRYRR